MYLAPSQHQNNFTPQQISKSKLAHDFKTPSLFRMFGFIADFAYNHDLSKRFIARREALSKKFLTVKNGKQSPCCLNYVSRLTGWLEQDGWLKKEAIFCPVRMETDVWITLTEKGQAAADTSVKREEKIPCLPLKCTARAEQL